MVRKNWSKNKRYRDNLIKAFEKAWYWKCGWNVLAEAVCERIRVVAQRRKRWWTASELALWGYKKLNETIRWKQAWRKLASQNAKEILVLTLFCMYYEFLDYISKGKEDRLVDRTIVLFVRLNAWLITVVKSFIERVARGEHRQKT